MKKKMLFLSMCINSFILNQGICMAHGDITVISPKPVQINPGRSNLMGIVKSLSYILAVLLIIFSIIKTISMIKKKAPVWKIILVLLLIPFSLLIIYGMTFLDWFIGIHY